MNIGNRQADIENLFPTIWFYLTTITISEWGDLYLSPKSLRVHDAAGQSPFILFSFFFLVMKIKKKRKNQKLHHKSCDVACTCAGVEHKWANNQQ